MYHICLYSLLWYKNSFRNDVLCFVDLVKNAFHAESNETRNNLLLDKTWTNERNVSLQWNFNKA